MKNSISIYLAVIFFFVSSSNFCQNIQEPTNLINTNVLSLAINANDNIFVGTQPDSLFCSIDNGISWTRINTGLIAFSGIVNTFTFNASGHVFAGTFINGVFRSTNNGDNWTDINSGLTNLKVYAFAFNSGGTIFAGTVGGVFSSTDNGDHWE